MQEVTEVLVKDVLYDHPFFIMEGSVDRYLKFEVEEYFLNNIRDLYGNGVYDIEDTILDMRKSSS